MHIEALRKTVQEDCRAILKAVVEKKTRGPGQPWGKTRHPTAYDVEEWM